MENKTAAGLTSPTDGPSGFVEFAADGSWLARFGQAGHMAFVDPGKGRPLQLAKNSLHLPAAALAVWQFVPLACK